MRHKFRRRHVLNNHHVRPTKPLDFSTGRKLVLEDLYNLYIRPVKFFESGIGLATVGKVSIFSCIAGLSLSITRIYIVMEYISLQIPMEYSAVLKSMMLIAIGIILTLVIGTITGLVFWNLGGFLYNIRLKWSHKDYKIDKEIGRIIYLYTYAIWALPVLIFACINLLLSGSINNTYSVYGELINSGIKIFYLISVINSYKASQRILNLEKGKALILLIILPIVIKYLI